MAEKGKHTNKVVVNGETILDLTQDTVEPSSLLKGTTAHDKSGAQVTGTYEAPVTSVNSKTGAVVLSASDVGAQPAITANGFLKGDGSGNITADKPVFTVNITPTEEGSSIYTADKTVAEIVAAHEAGYTIQAVCQVPGFPVSMALPIAAFDKTTFGFVFLAFSVASFMGKGNVNRGWTIVHSDYSENWHIYDIDMVPAYRTINSKPLSSNITLNASDVNAVGLTGDQTIAGNKTFSEEVTFGLGFTTGGSAFTGSCIFNGQQSFDDGMVVGGQTYYKDNSYISGKIHYDEDSTVDFTNASVVGLEGLLPTATASDNGKFLRVVNGAWAATTVENANGVNF